jgi:hypothetical protein
MIQEGDQQTSTVGSLSSFDFGTAIEMLKKGLMVQRSGWNGKGMFLFIRPEFTCGKEQFEKIVSVPENAKAAIMKAIEPKDGEETLGYRFTAYISMFAADKSIVNGWLASQMDILAKDWQVVI